MARFTASIDDNLKTRLDTYAEQNGYNRSEALEVMIRAFFQDGAPTPQPSPPQETPDGPSSPPSAAPGDSARLVELERRLSELQGALRVRPPRQLMVDVMEMQGRVNGLEEFLVAQHDYLLQLHDVVVSNAQAGTASRNFGAPDYYVPTDEPPAPGWVPPEEDE